MMAVGVGVIAVEGMSVKSDVVVVVVVGVNVEGV